MPFLAYQAIQQWFGNGSQRKHQRKGGEHRSLDDFAVGRYHALLVILNVTEYGIGDPLNDISQVGRKQRGELIRSCVLS